jgi:hypothetical protein
LLLLAGASHEPWDVTLPASVWARASVVAEAPGISKVWRRLAQLKLVSRSRRGRTAAITPLKEDGSGNAYTHPGVSHDRYFQLPYVFWTAEQRWYRTLDLAETAVLLIALSLGDGFVLPSEKAKPWYGLSADTIERGLRGLQNHGLLRVRRDYKEAPLSPLGYTLERRYTLQQPFGLPNRATATDEPGDSRPIRGFPPSRVPARSVETVSVESREEVRAG